MRTCNNFFCQDIIIFVIRERQATDFPVTAEAICYFDNHPKCLLNDQQYNWALDLDFLGPKPAPENPQLPPVSGYYSKMFSHVLNND
jgi:hypothetical protein